MLYLDENEKSTRYSPEPTYFSREITDNPAAKQIGLALQKIEDLSKQTRAAITEGSVNYKIAAMLLEATWQQVLEIVDTREGRNVRQSVGESPEPTPSVRVIEAATKQPSPRRLPKKA
jgi:hypothetical protein